MAVPEQEGARDSPFEKSPFVETLAPGASVSPWPSRWPTKHTPARGVLAPSIPLTACLPLLADAAAPVDPLPGTLSPLACSLPTSVPDLLAA